MLVCASCVETDLRTPGGAGTGEDGCAEVARFIVGCAIVPDDEFARLLGACQAETPTLLIDCAFAFQPDCALVQACAEPMSGAAGGMAAGGGNAFDAGGIGPDVGGTGGAGAAEGLGCFTPDDCPAGEVCSAGRCAPR